jgi:hypothetical protein
VSATTPLFDLYLGDIASLQGYRCRQLTRDSAPLIAPKFSTGSQGQTDLDLLKSASLDDVAGGMFQRTHIDSEKAMRVVGFYNPYDQNLYPTLDFTYSSTAFSPGNAVKVENNAYSFILFYQSSGGNTYAFGKKVVGSTQTSLTVPNSGTMPTGVGIGQMCIHKGFLYVPFAQLGKTAVNTQRYSISAGTWQDIGQQDAVYVSCRNILYSIDSAATVSSITNETVAGSATKTAITTIGGSDIAVNEAVEFNGAVWAAKQDGLYRFDGVSAVKVLNLNASKLTAWNGGLFFFANKWLYRFDGVNVQKLQYFDDTVYQLSTHPDYLLIQTWTTTTIDDSPKGLGTGNGFVRIYTYDGVGFGVIVDKSLSIEQFISHGLLCNNDQLYYVQPQFSFTAWDNCYSYQWDLSKRFATTAISSTNSTLEITSSEFDDGYPNIYKSLEYIEPIYRNFIAGDSLAVKYRTYDGKNWSAWTTAGTITSSSNAALVPVTDKTTKLFKRMQINVLLTPAANSTASLKGIAWRYTLQPKLRWRWQATLMAEGNNTTQDRSGAWITNDANDLTNSVIKSSKQKTPLYMLSPDYGLVKSQIDNATLTFIVKGRPPIYTDPYNEYPLVAVKNFSGVWEVLRVSTVAYNGGTDETTITVLERGYNGVTPAQINANAEFHLAYCVYITRVLRETPVLDEQTYNEQATGESQLQREWLLELIEV